MHQATTIPGWRAPFGTLANLATRLLPSSLLLLVARLGIASIFFLSGPHESGGATHHHRFGA